MADNPGNEVTVRYVLRIETEIEESGDYMRNSSLEEFMKWAQSQARSYQVLLKRGGTEPKPVQARIVLDSFTVKPRIS